MRSVWNDVHWTKKTEETQTGISLLLIFCYRHGISDLLDSIGAAAIHGKAEHPEKYSWWLNELDSLGISTLQKDGINNRRDASDLTDAVKHTLFYEEHLGAYNEK